MNPIKSQTGRQRLPGTQWVSKDQRNKRLFRILICLSCAANTIAYAQDFDPSVPQKKTANQTEANKASVSRVPIAPIALPEPIAGKDRTYRLIENWDFGTTVKTSVDISSQFHTRFVWENGTLDTLPSNGEWQRFRDNDNLRLEAGNLKLIAHIRHGLNNNGGIESGMIRSKQAFKYGYFEARVKVPYGRGLWPAFWLVPEDGQWPPEIDIVEFVHSATSDTRTSYHSLHPGKGDKVETLSTKLDQWNGYRPGFDFKTDFHLFAVEWSDDKVTHYVDNVAVAERTFHWRRENGSDAGKAQVLFTLAVGGNWPGPPVNLSDFPAAVDIDYIRVWQQP